MPILSKIWRNPAAAQTLRYLLVSGAITVIHVAIFAALHASLNSLNPNALFFMTFNGTVFMRFWLDKYFVFMAGAEARSGQMLRYFISAFLAYGVYGSSFYVLATIWRIDAVWALVVTIAISTGLTFVLAKIWVFGSRMAVTP